MARLAFALAALLAASCTGKDPYNPGGPVGKFHVTAKLVSTTCGHAPDPWEFDVKLRHEASTVYWVQGGAPVKGVVDTSARAKFEAIDTRTLRDADAKTKTTACVVSRKDSLDVVLSDGEAPATDIAKTSAFSGTLGYRFDPAQGSECADQLLEASGDFAALPCQVSYSVTAQRTGDLPK